ncbi:MAG: TRAP transporter small permease subunit [Hyphomicrobiaceae bacterium]|nr:MAG: TRAP transporter small permease subunit [Hyphomicrobiaceae bacterium]
MKGLIGLSRIIDAINRLLGRVVAWLLLVAVLVSAVNAIVRKALNVSSNAWLEVQWILFGAVFLLCAAWTLLSNEHIRIDIVNGALPKRAQNWIEVVGHTLFLIPMCLVLVATGWPFFLRSLGVNEQSTNAGGLPIYPSKFLIPLAFAILLIQAMSELIKRVAIMRGRLAESAVAGGHHAAAEAERVLKAAQEEAEQRAGS